MSRRDLQAERYRFPYHWLPHAEGDAWCAGRALLWGHEYLAVLSTVRDLVTARNPARVLDFGCGDGRLASELLASGVPEVVGVDLVEQAVAFARAFNLGYGDRAIFRCEPVEQLNLGSFDVAVVMEVLEHVPDGELAPVVGALHDRLDPEGCLILSVPTTNAPLNPRHERHYTLELLRAHLLPRFEPVEVRYVHRLSLAERWVRRLFVNRIACLLEPALRRRATSWYERRIWHADAHDGAHLVAVCHPS